jgi:starvation-inducible DNA-binding protein
MSASSAMSETRTTFLRSSIDIPEDTRAGGRRIESAVGLMPSISRRRPNTRRGIQTGRSFRFHELFDNVAGHCEEQSDLVAERVTALGGVAKGTVEFVVRESIVPRLRPGSYYERATCVYSGQGCC